MRLTSSDPEEIKLNMTAMIDIVFQLLVFFIMTFKVVEMEGDFNIRMPLATTDATTVEETLPDIIMVELRAGDNGNINSIFVDDQSFIDENMFINLTNYIENRVAAEGDPELAGETEIEFDIDYGLKYTYTVKAIEAVSGKIDPDGTVKKLIEKIKFKDNSQ
jgi:biopolymer transport protein ExbD